MLESRRWGIFRQEWYYICSSHRHAQEGCPRCESGMWVNVYKHKLSKFFFKRYPKKWAIWANRRNSTFNKWLKSKQGRKAFPNMRAK